MLITNRSFPRTAFLDQHSLQGIDNWMLVGIHHIQKVLKDRNTDHVYHLKTEIEIEITIKCST